MTPAALAELAMAAAFPAVGADIRGGWVFEHQGNHDHLDLKTRKPHFLNVSCMTRLWDTDEI